MKGSIKTLGVGGGVCTENGRRESKEMRNKLSAKEESGHQRHNEDIS